MNAIAKNAAEALALRTLRYVRKDPGKRLPALVERAERIGLGRRYATLMPALRRIATDESNNWNKMMRSILDETAPECLEKFLGSFVLNAAFFGNDAHRPSQGTGRAATTIPWTFLMDPTAACNLHCVGCWAAEYQKSASMDFELLDRIICEGKALGIYLYIYSGGEPLVRKDDLIRLSEKHPDCYFLAFTNATLIDAAFAKEVRRVGNLTFAISVEGFEAETDLRRGAGTYEKVIAAMDILKAEGVPFGFSTCYHRLNTDVVGSDAYIDLMVEKRLPLRLVLHLYTPGQGRQDRAHRDAGPARVHVSPHARATERQAYLRPRFSGTTASTSTAASPAGKATSTSTSAGDVEPCAFIHYSNTNIKDMSLLEAIKAPLFKEYAKGQPFNANHLRPCPLLDNPEKLRGMVQRSGAHSTQLLDEEDVVSLTAKCEEPSKAWGDPRREAVEAEELGGRPPGSAGQGCPSKRGRRVICR